MKKSLSCVAGLLALSGIALQAQDVTGTWQGVLPAGKELRIVIKISREDSGGLRALMYSIDQGPQALPGTVTLEGSTVKMSIPGIGASFEGKLSGDGNLIAGNFSQGPGKLALGLAKASDATAWAIPAPPAPPKPLAADAAIVFDVATIKPSRPEAQGKAFTIKGRQFITINTSLSDLITFSYGLHARQIGEAPEWVEKDKYDLTGQPEGDGMPNERQWKTMIQKLLADRFKLVFHRDKKELSVYALVVVRSGPKLTKSAGDPNGLPGLFFRGLGVLPATNATMGDFAGVLQGAVLDRPVVNQTGLNGRWDFTLTWTPDDSQFSGLGIKIPPPSDSASAPPNLFTAIQEQLGLRLESTRAPAEVFVVDRVEKPTPN
jgi:uncharacterized protein (TIGR03435 family)